MNTLETIFEGISALSFVKQIGEEIRVGTHCLYPSNGNVTVVVRGGGEQFVVSDEGGALSEISSCGIHARPTDRQIRALVGSQGLKVKDGVIFAPPVPMNAIPAAVLIVANASKELADWGLDHLRFSVPRNFRADLAELLGRRFHDNLKADQPIVGKSNKPHRFGHVIYLNEGRKILIDPVINDASSINARLVANLDVKMLGDKKTSQLIVYDDKLTWTASDLNLLQVGAPIVPFSRADRKLERLAA